MSDRCCLTQEVDSRGAVEQCASRRPRHREACLMDREHSPTTATARAPLALPPTGILAVVGRFSSGPTDTPVALTSAASPSGSEGPNCPIPISSLCPTLPDSTASRRRSSSPRQRRYAPRSAGSCWLTRRSRPRTATASSTGPTGTDCGDATPRSTSRGSWLRTRRTAVGARSRHRRRSPGSTPAPIGSWACGRPPPA
jgi:hypothetical protein